MKQTFTLHYNLRLQYLLIPILVIFFVANGYAKDTVNQLTCTIAQSENATPTITIESSMSKFEAFIGEEHTQFYYVHGTDIALGESVTLETSDPFMISFSSNSGFSNTLELTEIWDGRFDNVQVWVKYNPTTTGEPHSVSLTHSSAGADTRTLLLEGTVPTPMPVTLTLFTAKRAQQKIVLDWVTASEQDNSHFDVEVSKDPASGFIKAGSVASKSGNSSISTHYKFEYTAAKAPGIYYFRLKQVDIDGTFTYSKLIDVKVSPKPETFPTLAPNPIKEASKVFMTAAEAGKLNILITNIEGASVFRSTHELEVGENNIPLLLPESITAGMYFLTAEYNGEYSRLKFLKE